MSGFLNRIQKKKGSVAKGANDLIVRGMLRAPTHRDPNSPETQIITTSAAPGSPDDLLAELVAESKVPVSSAGTGAEVETTSSKIKLVQATRNQEQPKKKAKGLLDEGLPWWLTEAPVSSPQVNILVPAAREALNELLTDNSNTRDPLNESIKKAVRLAASKLSGETRFSSRDIDESTQELTSLLTGKGPLQPLYDDPAVTDIYMDGHNSIKCVRRGQAVETPFRFRSPDEYEAYITSMLQSVDRVLNLSSPIVDCVLNDDRRSRLNAVHNSLLDGNESSVVIRIPRLQQISFYDILQTRTLPATLAAWLAELVSCGEANILVCGPTGSGKTVLTTALLSAVGSDERICTIEDVPEIFVPTAHLEKLVCRPENAQGTGSVGMPSLLRAALRRAPHRIVVGEIRDMEGPLFLKALETGHAGSVATIHAEYPKEALWRLLDVVAAHEKAPQESIMRRISRSIDVIISMKKVNGKPCLMEIGEVRPAITGEFVTRTIVRFESENNGKRFWRICASESRWIDHLRERGMELQTGPGLLPIEMTQDGFGK